MINVSLSLSDIQPVVVFTFLLNYVGWKCSPYLVLPIFHYTFSEYFSLSQPNEVVSETSASILRM